MAGRAALAPLHQAAELLQPLSGKRQVQVGISNLVPGDGQLYLFDTGLYRVKQIAGQRLRSRQDSSTGHSEAKKEYQDPGHRETPAGAKTAGLGLPERMHCINKLMDIVEEKMARSARFQFNQQTAAGLADKLIRWSWQRPLSQLIHQPQQLGQVRLRRLILVPVAGWFEAAGF